MMNKTLNFREQYHLNTTETIASNFYPITSAIVAKDKRQDLQLTVMNDRTQAGAAGLRNNSNIELMQHRRLLIDDAKGLSEPMNEREPDS